MNDTVTILFIFEDGTWAVSSPLERWMAELDVVNVGYDGYWHGKRVLTAQIYPGVLVGRVPALTA